MKFFCQKIRQIEWIFPFLAKNQILRNKSNEIFLNTVRKSQMLSVTRKCVQSTVYADAYHRIEATWQGRHRPPFPSSAGSDGLSLLFVLDNFLRISSSPKNVYNAYLSMIDCSRGLHIHEWREHNNEVQKLEIFSRCFLQTFSGF